MPLPSDPVASPPKPTSMAELAPAERFVIWCLRRWVLGLRENNGGHCSMVWNEFAKLMGVNDGRLALSAFIKLINGLRSHARRPVYHHQPCCPCLVADEVWLVCLIAACQHRQPYLARTLIEWMVRPEGSGDVFAAGLQVARLMERHALTLPTRVKGGPAALDAQTPELEQITVH